MNATGSVLKAIGVPEIIIDCSGLPSDSFKTINNNLFTLDILTK